MKWDNFNIKGDEAVNFTHLSAQKASDPLYAEMRCGYGGSGVGRGYVSSIMTGDNCTTATIEFTKTGFSKWQQVQFFYFADAGTVKQEGALLPNELKTQTASSIGLGVRAVVKNRLNFSIQYGRPVAQDFIYQDKDETHTFTNLAINF